MLCGENLKTRLRFFSPVNSRALGDFFRKTGSNLSRRTYQISNGQWPDPSFVRIVDSEASEEGRGSDRESRVQGRRASRGNRRCDWMVENGRCKRKNGARWVGRRSIRPSVRPSVRRAKQRIPRKKLAKRWVLCIFRMSGSRSILASYWHKKLSWPKTPRRENNENHGIRNLRIKRNYGDGITDPTFRIMEATDSRKFESRFVLLFLVDLKIQKFSEQWIFCFLSLRGGRTRARWRGHEFSFFFCTASSLKNQVRASQQPKALTWKNGPFISFISFFFIHNITSSNSTYNIQINGAFELLKLLPLKLCQKEREYRKICERMGIKTLLSPSLPPIFTSFRNPLRMDNESKNQMKSAKIGGNLNPVADLKEFDQKCQDTISSSPRLSPPNSHLGNGTCCFPYPLRTTGASSPSLAYCEPEITQIPNY